jgi:hypothetical protein
LGKTKAQALAEWEHWDDGKWNPEILPHLAQLAPQFMQTHADDDFKFILDAYLNGLRAAARQSSF